jgi:DNA-binding transcriptional regulator YbjK
MQFQKRFGRKIPVPSTMEIKRDLVVMTKVDALIDTLEKEGRSSEDLAAILAKLVDEHHISSDRAQMLISRYDRKKAAPVTDNQDLDRREHKNGIS